MKPTIIPLFVTFAVSIASSVPVSAQGKKMAVEGPHGTFYDGVPKKMKSESARITNFRRREMRAISGHYRALEAIIRFKAPFKDAIPAHVNALEVLARQLPRNFVPGTAMKQGKWGAKPVVWSKPAEFKKHYESFQQNIAKLKSAIVAGDDAGMDKGLNLVRHECLACHNNFRARRKR